MKPVRLSLLLLLVLLPVGCVKQQMENYYATQESVIDNFVSKNEHLRVVYADGAVRMVVAEADGTAASADSLAADGVISFYYAGYLLQKSASVNNNNLFATNNRIIAESAKWALSDSTSFDIKTVKLDESDLLDGLKRGLRGVRSGEECYILFTAKYGFGNHASGTIPAKSTLAYHIWVESISNE